MDILYLDDYINIYSNKLKKILVIKPYQKTLKNGFIIDKDKFMQMFIKVLNENKINNNIMGGSITIITNGLTTSFYKENLIKVMEELNYKKIKIINEKTLINIDRNTLFINALYDSLIFYYLDELGKIKSIIYENDFVLKKILISIISNYDKKKIIVVGKNTEEVINLLDKTDYNYYYYENYFNYFIEKLI